ncbi:SAGA histone acetylase and TREX-2 complexes component [Tulasnella sp. 403]|nr:SAGA histone acetylase and TREX-2 complexes component [Tulasnella sp. 403]
MAPKSQSKLKAQPSDVTIKPTELAALQDSLVKRLIQTGEWDRISTVLKERLAESGWSDDTFHQAREHAQQQPKLHFQSLMNELVPKAEGPSPLTPHPPIFLD